MGILYVVSDTKQMDQQFPVGRWQHLWVSSDPPKYRHSPLQRQRLSPQTLGGLWGLPPNQLANNFIAIPQGHSICSPEGFSKSCKTKRNKELRCLAAFLSWRPQRKVGRAARELEPPQGTTAPPPAVPWPEGTEGTGLSFAPTPSHERRGRSIEGTTGWGSCPSSSAS